MPTLRLALCLSLPTHTVHTIVVSYSRYVAKAIEVVGIAIKKSQPPPKCQGSHKQGMINPAMSYPLHSAVEV